ncbi:hypothetical protein IB238_17105 [Rhizobium sp. ARZ01]|uniref:hypothetical protein n=1 Tax=Rhizobium sp. ARZ01 TaxID=2769313 RepID=UPI0017822135|nr:hypothetical protein [Rhizobium sp. ARZ01]MBD9374342.1 hypothetical protein [Rhizobium sp. ARZ01]
MKRILVIAAALTLSAPVAFADCAYHQTNAKANVDKMTTTASISENAPVPSDEIVLLKKQDKVVVEEKAAE